MKQEQVQIGGVYTAKVGARTVEVRIDRELAKGGWDATSLATNKKIRIKTALKLTPGKAAGEIEEAAPADEPVATREEVPAPPEAAAAIESVTAAPNFDLVPLTQSDQARRTSKKPGAAAAPREPKPAKTPKAPAADKPKAMGCLDAAAEVLTAAGGPMRCKQMITAMAVQGLWSSTAATPEATLYTAVTMLPNWAA